ANPTSAGRMPPVLDVAFSELSPRGTQQMLPGQPTLGNGQGDHVLELVAEAIGAPRLVERRPGPEPAGERLVEQPAVEQDVHRPVRGPNLDGPKGNLPMGGDLPEARGIVEIAAASDQVAGCLLVLCLAQEDTDLGPFARTELE